MGSISKCQKLYEEQNDKQCVDRISNLPSNLISHILSLLPTKYAVATSVLSTRWKLFWTLIISLDLDDKLLLHPEKSTNKILKTRFTNFVYRVLVLRRVSCLRMFRLKGCRSYDVSHVNTWVAACLVCGVQELDLSIRINECADQVLPRELFDCRAMVVLKLGTYFFMNVPASVHMQSLKILHLHHVKLVDDDSIHRLICGCPVLDELSMERCVGKHVRVIHICAPVLTKLFLKPLLYLDGSEIEDPKHEIVLDTPSLLSLGLRDDIETVSGYLVKNLSHLIKANLDYDDPMTMGSHEIISKAVTDLLMGISSVQCLVLHGDFVVALHLCNLHLPMLHNVPMFHNLTSLKLDWTCFVSWQLMLLLLEKSPRLDTLVLSSRYSCFVRSGDPMEWNPPQTVPTCLVSHLKVIKIRGFGGNKEELKMVEYFLKSAEVLEKVIIHFPDFRAVEEKVQMDVLKKLLRLPRASKICQLEMC
ncbi:hypothetical protein Vadar_016068 [Vaccinium darrowii]|uniref:Uncharacterized protein n=1 Tax=Vaccinium darrowii TaxID=229202 RepID=A0ACB7X196_9ERIC|nr:hypothetical protein Vadar_016068 [Vaccinium darrowii]